MKNTLETRLGIFFALALVALIIVIELIGTTAFLSQGKTIYARFNNVQELKKGDSVKMAGVKIGTVSGISLEEQQVRVAMDIQPDAAVKTDSQAAVKFAGLMGQNFVSISFGSPGGVAISEGGELESYEQPDLSSIMVKLDNVAGGVERLTRSFSGDSLNNLLGPLTDFLKNNTTNLTDIFNNVQTISQRVVEGEGTVGRLINEDTLYVSALHTVTNLNNAGSDIQSAIAQAQEILGGVQEGKGTMGKLATDETLYTETTAAMTNLRQILQKINQGEGSVGKLVNEETFYKNAKMTLQKVDKATEGLEDQGPLSVLGIAVNSLF